MKKTYDRTRAEALVPLLHTIAEEIADRTHEIRVIQGRLSRLQSDGDLAEILELKARMAIHRRELRMTLRELDRLGCVVDERNPRRILIPGTDGNLEDGFEWEASDPTLRQVSSGPAVT